MDPKPVVPAAMPSAVSPTVPPLAETALDPPATPATTVAGNSQAVPKTTPPAVIPAPASSHVTPTELEGEPEIEDSVSTAGCGGGSRDPSYWKLRRYFKPRASGALKCTPEAMKLWQSPEGRF